MPADLITRAHFSVASEMIFPNSAGGAVAIPGAFLAKAFVERMPVHIHTAILDVAVIAGGLMMISSALRSLL